MMHIFKQSFAFAPPSTLLRHRPSSLKRPRTSPMQSKIIPTRSCYPQPNNPPPIKTETTDDSHAPFWAAAGIEAMAALLAVALCRATHLPILGSNFALNLNTLLNAAGAAIPFSLAFWALEKAPTGITAATETRFQLFFQNRSPWEIAAFCACVALGEELLFRAWLLAGLLTCGLPPGYALLTSALVFGALHAYTKVYMLLASIAGALFGTMFLLTGSVLEPLIVHFLYDLCTILLMQRRWIVRQQ